MMFLGFAFRVRGLGLTLGLCPDSMGMRQRLGNTASNDLGSFLAVCARNPRLDKYPNVFGSNGRS